MKRIPFLWVLCTLWTLLTPLTAVASELLPRIEPTPAASVPARRVERLEISGNTVLSSAELEAAAAPWLGRALDEAEIEALRQHLSRVYVERGYLNSGLLLAPQQNQAGVLRLRAVEGRLTAVTLRGLDGLNPAHVRARLGAADGVLNMDQLRERFQVLLNDPLLSRVNARLLPGEQLGEAVLDVEVERARPWRLSAFANNYRPVSVGEAAVGLRGQLSNLSGQGDVLDAHLLWPASADGRHQKGQQSLGWRLPLTALGLAFTQLQMGAERGDSAITEEPVRQLDIRSRTRGLDLGLSHTLSESPAGRQAAGLQRQWRRQSSSLLGEPYSFTAGVPDGRVRESQWRLWHEGQWRSERQVWVLRSTLGLGRTNAISEPDVPGLEAAPAARFAYLNLQGQWLRKLSEDGLQLNLRLLAQAARDRLLPLSGMALGGVRSVRGSRENQWVRDEGLVVNLGLEWPWMPSGWDGLRVVLEPFVDYGRVRNRGQTWVDQGSAGLALRVTWRGWQLDLAAAGRIKGDAAASEHDSLQDRGLHVQLTHTW
jgi:hemolysin activation/secretion protein